MSCPNCSFGLVIFGGCALPLCATGAATPAATATATARIARRAGRGWLMRDLMKIDGLAGWYRGMPGPDRDVNRCVRAAGSGLPAGGLTPREAFAFSEPRDGGAALGGRDRESPALGAEQI